VFRDESHYTFLIQRQASISNRCQHFCPSSCLPLSFAAAIWCHRCGLKMNLHLRHYYYDTVACSGRKPRGNVQSCVGYWVYFGTRGVVLCKSHDVEGVEDAGSVLNTEGKEHGGVGEKKRYIYSSSCDFLVQFVLLVNKHKTAQPSSCTTTRHLMTEKP